MADKKGNQNPPPLYKVVLIGESDVGKSSTFIRFRDGKWIETLNSTIGLDHTSREVSFHKQDPNLSTGKVQIQLWDTAGLERTGRMTNNYYNNSRAVILMYDVTDSATLNRLQSWYEDAGLYLRERSNSDGTIYFLVGNKIDSSSSEIEVKDKQAFGFAKRFNIPQQNVFQISVKTGKGLDKFLNDIALILSETAKPVTRKNIGFDQADGRRDNEGCAC